MPLHRLLLLVCACLPALAWAQGNAVVCYDLRSGRSSLLAPVPLPAVGYLRTPHSFGTLAGLAALPQVAPTTDLVDNLPFTRRRRAAASFNVLDYPVRTAVTLFGHHRGQRQQFCSGTLVGERFVLTAAHCISDFSTRQLAAGADSILAVPAFDNGRDAVLPSALVERIYVFKSWSEGQGLNDAFDDLALLELARPIGQTVGWVGLGAYADPADYRGPIWHKFSYPIGDDLVQPPRYNGDTLYYEHGLAAADSAWLSVPGLTEGAPGMSGSSMFTTDNQTYWEAHGVFVFAGNFRHRRLQPRQLAAFARILAQPGPAVPVSTCLAEVQLFPNPVVKQLTVLPQAGSCLPLTICLYDALGRLLLTRTRQRIDALTLGLEFLPPGIYWLQLDANGQREVRKLIKVEP